MVSEKSNIQEAQKDAKSLKIADALRTYTCVIHTHTHTLAQNYHCEF